MKIVIKTNKGSVLSAIRLQKELNEFDYGVLLEKSDQVKWKHGNSFLIRYAKTCYPEIESPISNTNQFIRLCGNKWKFSEFCKENNIYAPIYYNATKPERYPVFLRKSVYGQNANGLYFVKSEEEFNNLWKDDIWSYYVELQYELRVHVLGGKIVKIFKKIPLKAGEIPEEFTPFDEENWPVKNNDNCHYSYRDNRYYPKLVNLVEELHKLNGWDGLYYSMDIGWDHKNKQYFFIEANYGPGLNQNSAKLYAEYLVGLIKEKENE